MCIRDSPYTCSLASHVLGLEFGVATVEECAELCWGTEGCTFYSYYSTDSSPLSLACAKLTECNDPTSDPSVASGPADCTGVDLLVESYPLCFHVGSTWVHDTSVTAHVDSALSCQSLCLHSSHCVSFSWHKHSEESGSNLCELFPSIGEYQLCNDCVSGPKSCTCSESFACSFLDNNLIEILYDVTSEECCQDRCARDPLCTWYTWYSSSADEFHLACALLSSCEHRQDLPADGSIKSGLGDCSAQSVLPSPCTDYKVLDSYTRHLSNPHGVCGGPCCDDTGSYHSPPDWSGEAWYRFSGAAGSQMRDRPLPDTGLCGTSCPGWLSGGHPSPQEGQVTRTVYYQRYGHEEDGQGCGEDQVSVINCGGYFVYHLPDVHECYLGYCGE